MRKIITLALLLVLASPAIAGTLNATATNTPSTKTADADTRILFHFNGADAATGNVFDATAHKRELQLIDGAALDTGQKQLGTASLELDGSNDYGLLPGLDLHPLGLSDFTIEAFVRLRTDFGASDARRLISYAQLDTQNGAWTLGFGTNAGWGAGTRVNFAYRAGGSIADACSSAVTIVKDTWYHLAVVRVGATVTFYLDGVAKGTATVSANLYVPRTAVDWYVGCRPDSSYVAAERHNGWIDELRVSSIARYTGAFTVPTAEFSP